VKTPGVSPGAGWSFSEAELPWIHPWGLVLSIHAALGDQQDRSSQNQDGAANVQDGGAHAAGGAQDKSSLFLCPVSTENRPRVFCPRVFRYDQLYHLPG